MMLTVILTALNACEGFLDKTPLGVAATENLNSEQGVDALLIGAYTLTDGAGSLSAWEGYSYPASPRNWIWDIASDDATKGSVMGDLDETIERYEILPTNQLLERMWLISYDGVSRSNDVLRSLEIARKKMDEVKANRIEAQAKWLRAWFHFRLQKMFYQIPYIYGRY